MNTKSYSNLPKTVIDAMREFSDGDCVLVEKKLDTANNKALNCHYNVEKQVKEFGGKVINGWLLSRSSTLINNNLYYWTFHSLWQTDDNKIYDITTDKHNARDFSTFWFDKDRKINLQDGVSYNDIVIFENKSIVSRYSGICEDVINAGKVFWTLTTMDRIRSTDSYNGEYRFIRSEFPNNSKLLLEKYNLAIVEGRLKRMDGSDGVHPNCLFEFSLNARIN
ncbi:hypothetical protein [Polynucleobacter sphagniphilus]|uniref:hypothetical protein n=1 Tax=Polynucleobacter sphagniphilus TaxID=1743169 RepID=UPI0024049E93|nr:hypothetical protein [Polynucleobacter sphagniphilus]MDF9788313.1 hypothetical protein [Polynucleobacter sphagniphilus]